MIARPHRASCFSISIVFAFVACGPRQLPVAGPSDDVACLVGDGNAVGDTLRVSIPQRIATPENVIPESAAERLVFRQLYEGLVAVDCQGRARPALAIAWHSDASMREWTFTLRDGVRFSDGAPLTSLDVLDAWERVWPAVSRRVPPGEYIDYQRAVTDGVVFVRLDRPDPQFPVTLGRADLAVARYPPEHRGWPLGTTGYSVAAGAGDDLVVVGTPGLELPSLVFVPAKSQDARDELDAGLDVVIDGDKDFVDYAARLTGFSTVALPWDRTYGIVTLNTGLFDPELLSRDDLDALSQVLARDVVSVDAVPVRCEGTIERSPTAEASVVGERLIVFPQDDGTAREIAERLVAMNNGGRTGRTRWRAAPIDVTERVGSSEGEVAAVVSVPSDGAQPCRAAAVWEDTMRAGTFLPVIRTRAHLVMRDGHLSAAVYADGIPRLFGSFRR